MDYVAPEGDLDFISLGPGDGAKDGHMAANWARAGLNVTYYPYDASPKLAAVAVKRVRSQVSRVKDPGQLKVKLVIADFWDADQVRYVFDYRPARNVVSLLGNLGNLDQEVALLQQLLDVLGEDDRLLLEVRLKPTRLQTNMRLQTRYDTTSALSNTISAWIGTHTEERRRR